MAFVSILIKSYFCSAINTLAFNIMNVGVFLVSLGVNCSVELMMNGFNSRQLKLIGMLSFG